MVLSGSVSFCFSPRPPFHICPHSPFEKRQLPSLVCLFDDIVRRSEILSEGNEEESLKLIGLSQAASKKTKLLREEHAKCRPYIDQLAQV